MPSARRQYLTDRKKRWLDWWFDEESQISEGLICTEAEVEKALRVLQTNFNIRETGILDDQTIRTMCERRCGNSDIQNSATGTDDLHTIIVHPIEVVGRRQDRSPRRPTVRRSYEGRQRSRKSVQLTTDTVIPSKSEGRETMVDYDLEPVEHVEENALERREQMLEEIRNRLEKTKTSGDERPLATRKSDLKAMRRFRRKRNIRFGDGNLTDEEGGNGRARHRLTNTENNPVRWRLLDHEISRKIPLADLKSAILLAFRMWSEVIPLRFIEDTEGDVRNIDVTISFGTGTVVIGRILSRIVASWSHLEINVCIIIIVDCIRKRYVAS